jgi:hypothetical protein
MVSQSDREPMITPTKGASIMPFSSLFLVDGPRMATALYRVKVQGEKNHS